MGEPVAEREYDVVVVGSGYGGAVAACRLAQAGLSVCLLEKGRRWEPHEFPTTVWQLWCNMRFHTPFGNFGRRNSLYQVHVTNDSLSVTASGLGGGSLINAGVIIRTPHRAQNDPRWPKEWHNNWDMYAEKGLAILKPESVPYDFPKSRVMDTVAGDIEQSSKIPLQLTMSFNKTENVAGVVQDECNACGNCLTGCPYNAKSSTDRNYLELASQAGAKLVTEKMVKFIVKAPEIAERFSCSSFEENYRQSTLETPRRWRVHLNAIDYISSDYVVLAAGVLGTAEILLKSKERGLRLSERLGHGLSCNGNNFAFVSGTSVKTQAYALSKKDMEHVTIALRPGPVISSSHISSLGFAIQASTIPKATPHLLMKGILTYKWPLGFGFFYGIWEHIKQWIGTRDSQALALNVMGVDASDGQIEISKVSGRLTYNAPSDSLFSHKIRAIQKIAQRIGGNLYLSRYRSMSVHLLGGCNAASDSSSGVTNPNGQVFAESDPSTNIHEGLYVCDSSVIPCALGVNPVGTILTTSERIASCIVKDSTEYLRIKISDKKILNSKILGAKSNDQVIIRESLEGEIGGMPCTMNLVMYMGMGHHRNIRRNLGEEHSLLQGLVSGKVLMPLLEPEPLHVLEGSVDMCWIDERAPLTQFMHYHLLLSTSSGNRFTLDAHKEMRPFLCGLWSYSESTTLHARLQKLPILGNPMRLEGTLHVSGLNLIRSLISLRGGRKFEFVRRLLGTLLRTYFLCYPRTGIPHSISQQAARYYPDHVLHEIITGDGVKITIKQWLQSASANKKRLVLLLNGYATECYCLPTESNDMIRTLLYNGYEPWLLQARLHPAHPCTSSFNLDDIASYDIPAAFAKMEEISQGPIAAHVIAHCIGGLAIHMALMGGHVHSSSVASLISTNSSMFFTLLPSAIAKLTLPLIPISMAILRDERVLPICGNALEEISSRHKILRIVARAIPRTESCVCDECNIFSGIFGNSFWHTNVRKEMHDWLAKKAIPFLAMSAFPHLRAISLMGHLVNGEGKEVYMIHPERLAIPTTYISGGRPILATPESSQLAHEFMKLYHPQLNHARIVFPDYGHSDIWIAENSHKDVFPQILERLSSSNLCAASIA